MADYFSEYSSFVGQKGLPSPADTPYGTPGFIRSKRSSRATANSSREQSTSPPPLPPDGTEYNEKAKEGTYSALDPRRFTPTLHASLVSEILNLRRELDSKNSLVENLETSLSTTRTEGEILSEQLAQHAKEARKARHQVEQMEKGTYEALHVLAVERDTAKHNSDDLRAKLERFTKRARIQDEDAVRTQDIWDNEKESWENERRQLERRVHVTENRLRAIVDEMKVQQAATEAPGSPIDHAGEESTFKDSGLGHESDASSIKSMTAVKHRRNMSSFSYRTRIFRDSVSTRGSTGTIEPHGRQNGHSLADELDIDEEDALDLDDFEYADEEFTYPGSKRRTVIHSRDTLTAEELDAKAKRVLGLTEDPGSPSRCSMRPPTKRELSKHSLDSSAPSELSHPSTKESATLALGRSEPDSHPVKRVEYKDNGYQPSPPSSPQQQHYWEPLTRSFQVPEICELRSESSGEPLGSDSVNALTPKRPFSVATTVTASPLSPAETPVVDGVHWAEDGRATSPKPAYSTASTQTDSPEKEQIQSRQSSKRDSLQPPTFVPSIAIHPPTSRPASPRRYVLPPGTMNAAVQTSLPWSGRDAAVQTEPIRVDQRLRKLPPRLQPMQLQTAALLPSPKFPERPSSRKAPPNGAGKAGIFTKFQPPPPLSSPRSPPLQSPVDSSPDRTRAVKPKEKRNLPLKALPLPKPTLAPAPSTEEKVNTGPLNRSSQYGVTRPLPSSSGLLDIDQDSEASDYDFSASDAETGDPCGSVPAFSRAPHGRFGLSEPPKAVPEDKEISPDRRPGTAESYGAAPAPSVSSSRPSSQRKHSKPPAKFNPYKDFHSRSQSSGSVVSSSHSGCSALPPYAIPTRSSSRSMPKLQSEGYNSPTPYRGNENVLRRGGNRSSRAHHTRQNSLRKVQSAAVIKHSPVRGKISPQKYRRRRRSPDLTPVQSMAFDTPEPTQFPIPDLPTPLQQRPGANAVKGSLDTAMRPSASSTTAGTSIKETSLVDAIAATMVGEWMWKYIRKRKSFGITGEATAFANDSMNTHGTRHKRWVWLSPYERTIMWDTKQPTSGPALLGKKGRKLIIQCVLDVPDHTVVPRNAELSSATNRSIIVLTNVRALKFTAVTQERHILWMTALSFLAQSGRLPQQFPPNVPSHVPPPPAPLESVPIKRNRSPSFGRATIRDSVRLAKGRRPSVNQSVAGPGAPNSGDPAAADAAVAAQDFGADFPAIPRLYSGTARHQRKRSNTSPRLPQPLSSIRNFSIPSSTSTRLHPLSSTNGSSLRTDARSGSSKSNASRRDSITSPDRPNFFEAVGTLRMEAFVDPNILDGVLYVPAPPAVSSHHHHHHHHNHHHHHQGPRRRRGDSNLSQCTADRRRTGYVFDENGMDPFKGF